MFLMTSFSQSQKPKQLIVGIGTKRVLGERNHLLRSQVVYAKMEAEDKWCKIDSNPL